MKQGTLIAAAIMVISICSAGFAPQKAQAQVDYVKQGITAYQRGDHKQAADILEKAVATPAGNNAQVHYYLANALLQSGQRGKAGRYYQSALKLNPPEPLAGYCRRGASLCGAQVEQVVTSAASAGAGSASSSRSASPRVSSADPRDASLIRFHRPTANSGKIQAMVMQSLACVPKSVKNQLHAFGFKVTITPTILELDPSQAQDRPSAYIHGGGIDNCPGYYDPNDKEIVIPERVSYNNAPPTLNRSVMDTMLHELGHAFDHARGYISHSEQFRKVYNEENSRLSNSVREEQYYFTQGGDHGPREAFAELFSIQCASQAGVEHRNEELGAHFPQSAQYIKSCMN